MAKSDPKAGSAPEDPKAGSHIMDDMYLTANDKKRTQKMLKMLKMLKMSLGQKKRVLAKCHLLKVTFFT